MWQAEAEQSFATGDISRHGWGWCLDNTAVVAETRCWALASELTLIYVRFLSTAPTRYCAMRLPRRIALVARRMRCMPAADTTVRGGGQ